MKSPIQDKMKETRERRTILEKVEIRSVEEGGPEVIEGYALKFNRWSEPLWGGFFREIIDSNALNGTDQSDVVAKFNHNDDYPLARNTVSSGIGSLELTVDNIGLKYRFQPTETSYANDLKANLRAGVVSKSSFAFDMDYEDEEAEEWKWNDTDKIYERTIKKIRKLWDVSPVVNPAYSDTESVIGARSLEKVEALKRAKEDENKSSDDERKKKILLEIDLI
jgi:HK97 family phage prohead protease